MGRSSRTLQHIDVKEGSFTFEGFMVRIPPSLLDDLPSLHSLIGQEVSLLRTDSAHYILISACALMTIRTIKLNQTRLNTFVDAQKHVESNKKLYWTERGLLNCVRARSTYAIYRLNTIDLSRVRNCTREYKSEFLSFKYTIHAYYSQLNQHVFMIHFLRLFMGSCKLELIKDESLGWKLCLKGNCEATLQVIEDMPPRRRRYLERRLEIED